MASSLREQRVAVGDPNARRSTVWKFRVNQSDVYILLSGCLGRTQSEPARTWRLPVVQYEQVGDKGPREAER